MKTNGQIRILRRNTQTHLITNRYFVSKCFRATVPNAANKMEVRHAMATLQQTAHRILLLLLQENRLRLFKIKVDLNRLIFENHNNFPKNSRASD